MKILLLFVFVIAAVILIDLILPPPSGQMPPRDAPVRFRLMFVLRKKEWLPVCELY